MKITGRQVAAARELLDMTQAQLAEATDTSKVTINTFEKGHNNPRPETLARILAVLEARGIEFTNGDGQGVRLRNRPLQDEKAPAP